MSHCHSNFSWKNPKLSLVRLKKHLKIIIKGKGSRFVETNTPFSQGKKFFLEDLKLFICTLVTVSSRALWPQDITELLDFWYKKWVHFWHKNWVHTQIIVEIFIGSRNNCDMSKFSNYIFIGMSEEYLFPSLFFFHQTSPRPLRYCLFHDYSCTT